VCQSESLDTVWSDRSHGIELRLMMNDLRHELVRDHSSRAGRGVECVSALSTVP